MSPSLGCAVLPGLVKTPHRASRTAPQSGSIPGAQLQVGCFGSPTRIHRAQGHGNPSPTTGFPHGPPQLGLHKHICKGNELSPRLVQLLWLRGAEARPGRLLASFPAHQGARRPPWSPAWSCHSLFHRGLAGTYSEQGGDTRDLRKNTAPFPRQS